mmetsp:Transcript_26996/g.65522  ORF Transcript_26996/g.65522 Transcript_26996/m.65522 type:complete len:211 (+) Transcript_26996:114-746(+)|eukprot:CAMPEP_0113644844 /NCGR_PEP_ID=MMETSP0017_2-20120614/23609_1 /TAXON_ID=2856 /ORGANISM="Cylindrotheca closterium" /LENGTH=210 /DNA_ID=CAMNT_0000556491 /DNA_START=103 /DNA_END=735 /DNA_ORIENTATION=- /assembly_acc=CAM_ASM_000147
MKFTCITIVLGAVACSAFHVQPPRHISSTVLSMSREGVSRRVAIAGTMGMSAIVGAALPASAGSAAPTPEELERIRTGYKQIQYLLDNFEQETTVCRENGGECKRDAEPIRRVLGLRSTTDPLFQIEKVFAKVKNMDIDPDLLDDFFEASEDWNSAMTLSNSMAFISQFGEYNPGGGKDEVLKYLIESKKQVEIASSCLKRIMKVLNVEI